MGTILPPHKLSSRLYYPRLPVCGARLRRGLLSRCNSGGGLGMCRISFGRDFLCYIHREAGRMRDLFVFIMITVCGRSKVESRELGTSVLRILILLSSLLHVLCMIYYPSYQVPSYQVRLCSIFPVQIPAPNTLYGRERCRHYYRAHGSLTWLRWGQRICQRGRSD